MQIGLVSQVQAQIAVRGNAIPLEPKTSGPAAGGAAALSGSQLNTAQSSAPGNPGGPPAADTVRYFSSADVRAAFGKGSPLVSKDGRNYWVIAGRREKPGQAELHEKDLDVIYVIQGTATFVTGGKMVEPKTTAPGEVRGSAIDGGESHNLSKDDVIIVPPGVPHWFKDVQGTFLYFVVKVQQP